MVCLCLAVRDVNAWYICMCGLHFTVDNLASYLGMARCFNVQGKKWSKRTNFQTLIWFKTIPRDIQLYQLLL